MGSYPEQCATVRIIEVAHGKRTYSGSIRGSAAVCHIQPFVIAGGQGMVVFSVDRAFKISLLSVAGVCERVTANP